MTHDTDVDARLRASLVSRLGSQRFDLWFAGCDLQLCRNRLNVLVPTEFAQQFLAGQFAREIVASAEIALGFAPELEFSILKGGIPASAGPATPPSHGKHVETSRLAVVLPDQAAARAGRDDAAPKDTAPKDNSPKVTAPNGRSSSPLPSVRPARHSRPWATLPSFVGGVSNQLALTAAQLVVEEPGRQNPLFLHGPTAIGKTHLAEGICHAARERGLKAIYQTAEQFTSMFVTSVRGTGMASFRGKYHGLDLLVIDDVHFFTRGNKKGTIGEFLQTIDTYLRAGRQLVFAADRPPSALPELGRELQSRLHGGLMCGILPPDAQLRGRLVTAFARQLELELPAEVQQFVAANLTAHARQLQGAVNLLKAISLTQRGPISLSMAERMLAEMVEQNVRPVRLADIAGIVSEVFGLEADSLRSDRKDQAVSRPRMLAMFLARKHTRAALSEIGEFFGGRKHSTVVSAQKKVANWMAHAETVQLAKERCSIEETIHRLEQRLAVG